MTFILVDSADDRQSIQINAWNWRPTIAILVDAGIIPSGERAERCLCQGCGGHFTEAEVVQAADFLEKRIAGMKSGERIRHDGSVTDKPKNYALPISEWDEQEIWERYSASYEWMRMFIDFCRRSKGFEVC